ncbi:MAG: cytochrome c [Acidimicrobiaceae bacterium]|nr:cytochrome c [Acidimicrobiaceae bacterium]
MVGVAVRRLVPGILVVGVLLGSCAGDPPEVPLGPDGQPDPVLADGRAVYAKHCAACHGRSGGGGQGPRLDGGAVVEAYPEFDDQVAVVADGSGTMPSFVERLTDRQIAAVTRYTREVLG